MRKKAIQPSIQETQRNENRKTQKKNRNVCSSLLEAGHLWRAQMGVSARIELHSSCRWWMCTMSGWWQLKHFFIFTPIPGEMIQFDDHIFQIGGNHHLDVDL